MDLITLWFVLIAALWTGYLILEGFDFGVGMLLPILSSGPGVSSHEAATRRRTLLTTIGPHWEGNEVWLITAIGATFAAFPHWYATMLSAMYPLMLALLASLIVRNVGLEYRHKRTDERWVRGWDRAIIIGSGVAPFAVGVILTHLVHGLPMSEHPSGARTYTEFDGGILDLLTPVAVLGGLTLAGLCLAQGALFIALKTTGPIRDRARRVALPTAVAAMLGIVASAAMSTMTPSWIAAGLGVLAMLLGTAASAKGADAGAFLGTSTAIAAFAISLFVMLFPLAITGRGSDPDLTLAAAASSPMTLTVLTWAAAIFAPAMIGYTIWSYWIFRRRLSVDHLPVRADRPRAEGAHPR